MNLTLEFDPRAAECVALFAQATSAGMFSSSEARRALAVFDDADPRSFVLELDGVDQESLLGLRRMLTAARLPVPAPLRDLALPRRDTPLEESLPANLRDHVSVDGVGELSGEALFMSVLGLSAGSLYEVVQPVVAIWGRLLARQAFPYDVDEAGPSSTEGIEVYEISAEAVEMATQSYGGDEEGIAALVSGTARQLQRAGLSFHITCWSA